MGGYYFLWVLIWKNLKNSGKTAVFPGGYGRIGVYRVNSISETFPVFGNNLH